MVKNPFRDLVDLYARMDRELENAPLTSSELDDLRRWSLEAERVVDRWIGERHAGRCLEVESRRLFWKALYAAMLAACATDRYLDAADRGWPPEHRDADGRRCAHEQRFR